MLARFRIAGCLVREILNLPDNVEVVCFYTKDNDLVVEVDLAPEVYYELFPDTSGNDGSGVSQIPDVAPVYRKLIISQMQFVRWDKD